MSKADAMQFGSFIHKVFELGVQSTTYAELDIIAQKVRNNYKFNKSFENKTKVCLENFLLFNKDITNTISTELEYEIMVDEANDIKFNGVIDRIIPGKEGSILVIDYKTGKEKTRSDLFFDTQLKGYTFAVHELYKVPYKNIIVGHYYPISNKLITLNYQESLILNYIKEEIGTVWKIRKLKSNDFKANRNQFCNWCSFKGACPEFTDPQKVQLLLESWPKRTDTKS